MFFLSKFFRACYNAGNVSASGPFFLLFFLLISPESRPRDTTSKGGFLVLPSQQGSAPFALLSLKLPPVSRSLLFRTDVEGPAGGLLPPRLMTPRCRPTAYEPWSDGFVSRSFSDYRRVLPFFSFRHQSFLPSFSSPPRKYACLSVLSSAVLIFFLPVPDSPAGRSQHSLHPTPRRRIPPGSRFFSVFFLGPAFDLDYRKMPPDLSPDPPFFPRVSPLPLDPAVMHIWSPRDAFRLFFPRPPPIPPFLWQG